ncbi:ATP-dependent Clp protease proteolytic subunit [Lignipirellula cremea]|uniref:ATP-dependent Clp protease proteolytic subunit n=1 Tax=Lignipirellula cremea TaxID=2528010 RepID=A0A518E2H0_9BACT|nr:ATP-dependent Clp protease proteolytic subunit [Lignipirellula cremea]QDU98262.1 ATP-dependent Clp protease proteolytic subunit [Lignipirellula cremea]
MAKKKRKDEEPEVELHEIAITGDLTDTESDITERLLDVPVGSECLLYFNSPGGNPHSALALTSLLLIRNLDATGIVTGECSSAALWPFAACRKRYVTPHSLLLFHPLKSESEQNISHMEAAEWARYLGELEEDMDRMLSDLLGLSYEKLVAWARPGRFVNGKEFADAGLAQMVELRDLARMFGVRD